MSNSESRAYSRSAIPLKPTLIRASAGSGKTFQLSNRLIQILLAGESPEHILATTFTRKAAAEILHRVILRLARAAMSAAASSELARQVGSEKVGQEHVLNCIERLADSLNLVNICTLDSWFIQIAQVFPLELGIDPAVGVLDSDQREQLLTRSIGRMLLKQSRDDKQSILYFLNKGRYSSRVISSLLYDVRNAPAVLRYLEKDVWNWIKVDRSQFDELYKQTQSAFAGLNPPLTKNNEPNKHWVKALSKLRENLAEQDIGALTEGSFARSFLDGSRAYYGVPFPEDSVPAFEQLCRLISVVLRTNLHLENLAAGQVLENVFGEFDQLAAEERKLGFEELKLKLLQTALSRRSAEIYYRLDRNISHLLLDEFQDTSIFEWQILQPFIDELLSKSGEWTSFFCVGDVKQSIYGWRGGCSALFQTIEKTYPQVQIESLDKSYRSAPAIIYTVNRIFGSLAENPAFSSFPAAARSWSEDFQPHFTAKKDSSGQAELTIVQLVDEKLEPRDQVLLAACDKINDLHQKNPQASIGVLVRTNATVLRILYHLSQRYPQIPASEEGGNPLTDSLAVSAMLSLLKLIDHPGDTISRFHVMTSPLAAIIGVDEPAEDKRLEAILTSLRRDIYQDGFGALLSRIVQRIAAKNLLSSRDHRRLRRLVELGYLFDRREPQRIAGFISFIKQRRVADSSAVPVRVMTIHGSKGLEFDSVILPDLDQSLIKLHHSRFLVHLPAESNRPKRASAYCKDNLRPFAPELKQFFDCCADESMQSELCNLYVATTRARDELYMFIRDRKEFGGAAEESNGAPSMAKVLYYALAEGSAGSSDKLSARTVYRATAEDALAESAATEAKPATVKDQPAGPISDPSRPTYLHETPSGRNAAFTPDPGSNIRILERKNQSALSFGRLVHRGFEKIEWLSSGPPALQEIIQALTQDGGDRSCSIEEAEQAAAVVCRTLSDIKIQPLFNKRRYDGGQSGLEVQAFRELPFLFRSDRSVISGTIDRLVVCLKSGRPVCAEIIDFKTDILTGLELLEGLQNRYRGQIEDYLTAAVHLTGLPRSKISACLVLTSKPVIVPM